MKIEDKINKLEKALVSLYGEKDEIKASLALISMNKKGKEAGQEHFIFRAIHNLMIDLFQRNEYYDRKICNIAQETRDYLWEFYIELKAFIKKIYAF